MLLDRVRVLGGTLAVAGIVAATLAVVASVGPAAAAAGASTGNATPSNPSLLCTFTVNGRYRSAVTIDATYLQRLGVPDDEVQQVLNNLAAKAPTFPADWNVHCVPQGTFGPAGNPNVGGHPSITAPFVNCQMNNVTPSSDTTFSFNEAFLQYMGIRPSAWPTVLGNLSSLAGELPSSWGVTCTTQNAGNSY